MSAEKGRGELELRLKLRAADQYFRERARVAEEWERIKTQTYAAAIETVRDQLIQRARTRRERARN